MEALCTTYELREYREAFMYYVTIACVEIAGHPIRGGPVINGVTSKKKWRLLKKQKNREKLEEIRTKIDKINFFSWVPLG